MATPRLAKERLKAADGGLLYVDIRTAARPGERRPAVVICHGFKGFKDWGFFPRLADRLAVAGFTAISFNFSGSGVGDGEAFDELDRWAHQTPSADLADLKTVVDYAIAEQGAPTRGAPTDPWVGLVGHSRGGGIAALHAARDPRVDALVTWAAIDHFLRWPAEDIARWRRDGKIDVVNARTRQVLTILRDALDDLDAHGSELNVATVAPRIRAPWLVVHGSADATVPIAVAHQLVAASAAERTSLLALEGADHTFGIRHPWAGTTPAFDLVLERTVGHFAAAL